MTQYVITLVGCDDETCFNIELSDEELNLVKKISELSVATSEYSCMPRFYVGEVHDNVDEEDDDE